MSRTRGIVGTPTNIVKMGKRYWRRYYSANPTTPLSLRSQFGPKRARLLQWYGLVAVMRKADPTGFCAQQIAASINFSPHNSEDGIQIPQRDRPRLTTRQAAQAQPPIRGNEYRITQKNTGLSEVGTKHTPPTVVM